MTILILITLLISTIKDIPGFVFIPIGGLFGYIFTSIFINSNLGKKVLSEKLLKFISYFIFIFTVTLFASFLIRLYFPNLLNNYLGTDYVGDIYEFLNHYRFSHPSIPLFRFTIETLSLFFFLDAIFISLGIGILFSICFKIFDVENKKGEEKS